MMYEELIKKLRYCGKAVSCLHCPYWVGCGGPREELMQAADAIEELSKRIDRAIGMYNRNIEKTAMYEALAGISPETPKEGEE